MATLTNERVPSYATGAADVRIFVVQNDGHAFTTDTTKADPPLGAQEIAVARRDSRQSVRTVNVDGDEFRVVAVPYLDKYAIVIAQNAAVERDEETTSVLAGSVTSVANDDYILV